MRFLFAHLLGITEVEMGIYWFFIPKSKYRGWCNSLYIDISEMILSMSLIKFGLMLTVFLPNFLVLHSLIFFGLLIIWIKKNGRKCKKSKRAFFWCNWRSERTVRQWWCWMCENILFYKEICKKKSGLPTSLNLLLQNRSFHALLHTKKTYALWPLIWIIECVHTTNNRDICCTNRFIQLSVFFFYFFQEKISLLYRTRENKSYY